MPELPKIAYRLMAPTDIDAATYIRKGALEGLARSENRDIFPWTARRSPHLAHLLKTDPGGSYVAESDGLVVGFSMGFVRGDIWFLAQLFVQPDVHSLGIGAALLKRAHDAGRDAGARIVAVVASSSAAAQSLYMRHGMFGTAIGYHVSGPVDALLALPAPDGNRKLVVDCDGWQDRISALDAQVYGAERRAEHEMYLTEWADSNYAFALNRDGELIGYGYALDSGYIGPLAAVEPDEQLALLRVAGDWLAERQVSAGTAYVTSTNQVVMGTLLSGGWKITNRTYLLASQPFGQFDRYVPSGGLLL